MNAATALITITCIAAFVNGALGYGFSSITVPVALLFFANRILNPALVLVEVAINAYALLVNRKNVALVWPRVFPIALGLLPGVLLGSYVVASISSNWMKLATYCLLLPLILIQATGLRRPVRSENLIGVPFGAGLGFLYSTTTISGPPIALFLNNQGLENIKFRASVAIVRTVESSLTAMVYYHLGLFTATSFHLMYLVTPGLIIGVPLGAHVAKRLDATMFSRICRTFDVWLVGFGLSRVLLEVGIAARTLRFAPLLFAAAIDAWFLWSFFDEIRFKRTDNKPYPAPR